jgi:hypothetical protein
MQGVFEALLVVRLHPVDVEDAQVAFAHERTPSGSVARVAGMSTTGGEDRFCPHLCSV